MPKIIFLGTGHGQPHFSSCSSILFEEKGQNILFDVSGGQEIVRQFYAVNKKPGEIQNIFISHYDSDHILGIVPLVRVFQRAEPEISRNIFCSAEVKAAIESLFTIVARDRFEAVRTKLHFVVVEDRQEVAVGNWQVTFFDVQAKKSPQMGCRIKCVDGTTVAFLGDEPLRDHYMNIVQNSDILIHEAFCLEKDEQRFNPHDKGHSTVKEAAENAARADAKTLSLFHMEDITLATRKEQYTAEAKKYFKGNVFVPVDGDIFEF
jgi:ribonuclease Z